MESTLQQNMHIKEKVFIAFVGVSIALVNFLLVATAHIVLDVTKSPRSRGKPAFVDNLVLFSCDLFAFHCQKIGAREKTSVFVCFISLS